MTDIDKLLKKTVAQFGVVLYITSMLESIFYPFIFLSGWLLIIPIVFFESGILLLLVAAVLPSSGEDRWGSMWPLVGYDNAIDGIYTRGPWRVRFQELEESETQKNVTSGMISLFDVGGTT